MTFLTQPRAEHQPSCTATSTSLAFSPVHALSKAALLATCVSAAFALAPSRARAADAPPAVPMTAPSERGGSANAFVSHTSHHILLASNDMDSDILTRADTPSYRLIPEGKLVAQAEGDDAYDPFADYSEFEETADEEEDLNFFRNGRLLTVGFLGGYRGWTGTLGSLYSSGPTFGLYLCYFFDLRFALQFGYVTNETTLHIPARAGAGSAVIDGNINIDDLQVLLKYYFNTQNVTRGLASLNPYVVGGFSQVYRTTTVSGNQNFGKDSAFGFDIGAGLELPMMRNKMYFGGQALYQIINFSDANKDFLDAQGVDTGVKGSGSSFTLMAVLGINF